MCGKNPTRFSRPLSCLFVWLHGSEARVELRATRCFAFQHEQPKGSGVVMFRIGRSTVGGGGMTSEVPFTVPQY